MDFGEFVLAAVTADLGDEPQAREHADAVEFRMDLSDDPLADLSAYEGDLPVLATNRAAWEGGVAGGESPDDDAEVERLDALATAVGDPAVGAVDVELRSVEAGPGERVVERARETGTSVVVSVHDFEGTPDDDRMRDLLGAAVEHGDVGKLAVAAESTDDVLALLSVTRDLDRAGERVATMAMGEAGRHSRVVAPLYGSRIAYAPVDPADATAPGQFDLRTFADLLDALGPEPEG